ncbi:uncharacterized protein LOC135157796 [Lytechinus pictus]|uniref:uncharacterized protein LOC135157796 n=1 Tax=Lytechinus pictus TaxID=7653 RepID=UPI0030B9BF18
MNPPRESRSRANMEEEEVLSDNPRHETDSPAMKKKRKAARLFLSDEQEEELVEWLKSNPELFNKSHQRYKDIDLKNSIWEDKASELGMQSGDHLQVWYKSMRTRFGKLRKIMSVNKSRQLTWRDQWILRNFDFISPHIYVCNRGGGSILKQKFQSRLYDQQQSGSEDEENYEDLYKLPSIPNSIAAPSPSVNVPTAASSTAQLPAQMDSFQTFPVVNQVSQPCGQAEQLLAGISAAVSAGQNNSMAKGFGNFLSSAVTSLHPSLLTSFYQESWALVMKYHVQSEELKEKERQVPVVPLTVRPIVNHLPQMSQSNAELTVQSSPKAQSEATQQSPRSRQR